MTAGVSNNYSKFSKPIKLTKFMIYSTCIANFLPRFDFHENLAFFFFHKAINLACTSSSRKWLFKAHLQCCINFKLVSTFFSKDGQFGVYFKISAGDIRMAAIIVYAKQVKKWPATAVILRPRNSGLMSSKG